MRPFNHSNTGAAAGAQKALTQPGCAVARPEQAGSPQHTAFCSQTMPSVGKSPPHRAPVPPTISWDPIPSSALLPCGHMSPHAEGCRFSQASAPSKHLNAFKLRSLKCLFAHGGLRAHLSLPEATSSPGLAQKYYSPGRSSILGQDAGWC